MKRVLLRRLGVIMLSAFFVFLSGCEMGFQVLDGDGMERSYKSISQDDAKIMMEEDDGHVIVDVRRQDEFDGGHIKGAICIPNESIGKEMPEELPDKDQIILIYCRSGRRSKEAAGKLFNMGYSNIYEFGGIMTWDGDVITSDEEVEMAAVSKEPMPVLVVKAGEKQFYAVLEDNPSAEAFLEKLSKEPLELELHDYGNFEKVGSLPYELPRSDERITTSPGDIILYQGDQITIYYDTNTWDLTRLARIDTSGNELKEALGDGNVTVSFYVEWTE